MKQREIKSFMTNIKVGSQNNDEDNINHTNEKLNQHILNENSIEENTMHGGNNPLIRELANQIKNELKPNPQVIFLTQKSNPVNNQTEKYKDNMKNKRIIDR